MDTEFVLCEEETEYLNVIYLKFRFQILVNTDSVYCKQK